jgi:hypothetical protein
METKDNAAKVHNMDRRQHTSRCLDTVQRVPTAAYSQYHREFVQSVQEFTCLSCVRYLNVARHAFTILEGNHDVFPVDQYNNLPIDMAHYDDFQWLRTAVQLKVFVSL